MVICKSAKHTKNEHHFDTKYIQQKKEHVVYVSIEVGLSSCIVFIFTFTTSTTFTTMTILATIAAFSRLTSLVTSTALASIAALAALATCSFWYSIVSSHYSSPANSDCRYQ